MLFLLAGWCKNYTFYTNQLIKITLFIVKRIGGLKKIKVLISI